MLAALGAVGCAQQTAIEIHPKVAPSHLAPGAEAGSVERMRERHRVAAADVEIVATLWDGALVAAALERGRERGQSEATLETLRRRFGERYVGDVTAFTVVVELGNRPPPCSECETGDPLADPRTWHFVLDRGEQRDLQPRSVVLQGIDRFPTGAGGHHLRLAFAVTFDGGPLSEDASTAERLRLRVRADREQVGLKRRELGPWIASRGAALSWWVSPG